MIVVVVVVAVAFFIMVTKFLINFVKFTIFILDYIVVDFTISIKMIKFLQINYLQNLNL
jgi:hypothetical protein